MSAIPKILSVGQCGSDDHRLSRFVGAHAGAHLESAESAERAVEMLARQSYDLVLVNRVFDVDGDSGVDFISRVRAASPVPVMLVSDYEEAQSAAEAAGALRGFGKSGLHDVAAITRLRDALGKNPGGSTA